MLYDWLEARYEMLILDVPIEDREKAQEWMAENDYELMSRMPKWGQNNKIEALRYTVKKKQWPALSQS